MRPALTVLQLDTHFPRVQGDVACPDTYGAEVEIMRIPAASVGRIVTQDPGAIDIAPFEDALGRARGDIIATSCGFLAHWQDHLQALSQRPFVASALGALRGLDDQPTTLTFDAGKLLAGHGDMFALSAGRVIGLSPNMHLRRVIEHDDPALDQPLAQGQIVDMLRKRLAPDCTTLLLECTNLPPYKQAMRDVFNGRIFDILTEIEARRPGTVRPAFL